MLVVGWSQGCTVGGALWFQMTQLHLFVIYQMVCFVNLYLVQVLCVKLSLLHHHHRPKPVSTCTQSRMPSLRLVNIYI